MNTIPTLFFILLLVSSCGKIDNNETGTGIIEKNNEITGTGISLINENSDKELSIEEKIKLLNTNEVIISALIKDNDGDYFEEIPRIESYYTNTPFYEFYLFKSVIDNDVNVCNKIEGERKNLCINLFNSKDNINKFASFYKEEEEEFVYAKYFFQIYDGLKKNECIGFDGIIDYLACKKMFDKNLDIRNLFIKYTIFERSNYNVSKKYYLEISNFWGMDEGFKELIKKMLYSNKS